MLRALSDTIIRTAVSCLTILVSMPFAYLVFYWWFIPDVMQHDALPNNPPLAAKILGIPVAIAGTILAQLSAERIARSLRAHVVLATYRLAFASFRILYVISGSFVIVLLTPLVGLPAPSPNFVFATFVLLSAFGWSKVIAGGFGVHAVAPPKQSPSTPPARWSYGDGRPPIVYLRSFEKERNKATLKGRFAYIGNPLASTYQFAQRPTSVRRIWRWSRREAIRTFKRHFSANTTSVNDEQAIFGDYFSLCGPYIAIARPGEVDSAMDSGATKVYSPDERWKTDVCALMDAACAVIVDIGRSGGLQWEIEQVLARVAGIRVLLLLPTEPDEYESFLEACGHLFPHPLPYDIPTTRLLMFTNAWEPIPLGEFTWILEDALFPFVERLVNHGHLAQVPA